MNYIFLVVKNSYFMFCKKKSIFFGRHFDNILHNFIKKEYKNWLKNMKQK